MNWVTSGDSMSWAPGTLGKGYLLHNGVIKTWAVDPFHPEDQRMVWQRNQETSPPALYFDIDPDGGVVTDSPTIKVEQIINADQRLYDAGQRPVWEDSFAIDQFEPKDEPTGSPDFNFVMSGWSWPHEGAWVNHPPHINRFSGLPCDCPWGQPKHWHRTSGVNKRRLLRAPDKAYKTPEGKAFQRYIKTLPDEYDALIPYLGMRFKKGDMRYVRPGQEPGSVAPRLEYHDATYLGGGERWAPVAPHLPRWQQWLEARQHPTRRGVNILDPALTPQALNEKVQEHQQSLQEAEDKKYWLQTWGGGEPVYRFGPEAGKYKGWQIVALDEAQAEADSSALGHCFTGNTLVRTRDGYRPIVEIAPGDEVLSANGEFVEVVRRFERDYDGPIYGITTPASVFPIHVTSEHPFYALQGHHPKAPDRVCRRGQCTLDHAYTVFRLTDDDYSDIRSRLAVGAATRQELAVEYDVCLSTISHVSTGRIQGANREQHRLAWVNAADLGAEAYIATAVPTQSFDRDFVEVPVTWQKRNGKGGATRYELSPEFLWLVGLYIAEGSNNAGEVIQYALHKDEEAYAQRIETFWGAQGFNVRRRKDPASYQGLVLQFGSRMIAGWWGEWLGVGCANKQIPAELLNLPAAKLRHLVQGIVDGDGCARTNELKQTSPMLALQIAEASLRLGGQPRYSRQVKPDRKTVHGILDPGTQERTYERQDYWRAFDHTLVRLSGYEIAPYTGKVYNLEVGGDHTYVVQTIAVHNCIGSDEHNYKYNIGIGNIAAFSLRDKEGYPHATWHINPSGEGIGHIQGKSGEPKPEYRELISMFNKERGLPDHVTGEERLEGRYRDTYELPSPTDVDDYVGQYDDPWSYAAGEDDVGPETEITPGDPDWAEIAQDYLRGNGEGSFFRTLSERGDDAVFASALGSEANFEDLSDRDRVSYWNSRGADPGSYIDMPSLATNEVDKYNDAEEAGEEPEPDDWDEMAQDYLTFPGPYGQHAENRWEPRNHYQKFHDTLADQEEYGTNNHREQMHDALQRNIDWANPEHQQAIQWWNDRWPQNVAPQPQPPAQIPGQVKWDWPPHDQWTAWHSPDPHPSTGPPNWDRTQYVVPNNSEYFPRASSWHLGAELHVGLAIPAHITQEINAWAKEQDWPKGTELEDPSKYHITLLYSPDGHEDHHDADWINHAKGYDVEVTGLDEFGEDEEKATVLRIASPAVKEHAHALQDEAEDQGLEISRFPGGYKPHITIAYGPGKPKASPPKLKFKTGPSSVSSPRESSWHFGDYHGWTDWETWHTALMMDNDEPIYRKTRQMIEQGASVEQLKDYLIRKVVGPYNRQQIEDAREWNETPYHERSDPHFEDLMDKSPQAADFVMGLGDIFADEEGKNPFGPDLEDTQPKLMDPETINWREIWDHLYDEQNENAEYDREHQRLKDQGLSFAMPGHSDETNTMLDAWLKHHGVLDKDQRLPGGGSAEHHTTMQVPIEHLPHDEGEWSPETHVQWQQQGYGEPRVRSYGWNTLWDIQKGRANPWQQQRMQEALQGQGYTPEQIQQLTRQKQEWVPSANRWVPLETAPAPQPDQPGQTTFPQEWTSSWHFSLETPWGQDHDDWAAQRPAYDASGHQLGYDPTVHQEGKGFILQDGSVWTWPTAHRRPMHLEYSYRVKRNGQDVAPGSAFHINQGGKYFQYGEGRALTPDQHQQIVQADPRLTYAPAEAATMQGGGHGTALLDKLREQGLDRESAWHWEETFEIQAPGRPPRLPVRSRSRRPPSTRARWDSAPVAGHELAHATESDSSIQDWPSKDGWSASHNPSRHSPDSRDSSPRRPYSKAGDHRFRQIPGLESRVAPAPGEALPHPDPSSDYTEALNILAPATELREWLADLGGAEPISPHHDAQEDFISAPRPSYPDDLPYFPPANVPKEYKQSAMTLPQEIRDWEQVGLEGSPEDQVGQLPNGYTVQRHRYPETMNAVGDMMRNCWQERDQSRMSDEAEKGFVPHSLHDEHGIPRAAFYVATNPRLDYTRSGKPSLTEVLGMRNQELRPQYAQPLADWATQQGYLIKGSDPAEWLERQNYWQDHWDRIRDENRARQMQGSAKTADSPITQADATNDPLGKNPAIIPSRKGDPDYLDDIACPHCQKAHKADEPCATNPVTQFKQEQRAWYRQDPNAVSHGPGAGPNGLHDQQMDLGKSSGWHVAPESQRASLEEHGLDAKRALYGVNSPEGFYGHPTLEGAQSYKELMERLEGEPHDLWEITPDRSPNYQDEAEHYWQGTLSPDRLRRLQSAHPGPDDPQGGWEDDGGKLSAMTLPQQQRQWQALNEQFPNTSERIHEFPNGWSVQRPTSTEDILRVGHHMRNCWQGGGSPSWQENWNPHVLHDEHDHPRLAFMMPRQTGYAYDAAGNWGPPASEYQIKHALGPHNNPASNQELDLLKSWAEPQGIDFPDWLYQEMPDQIPGNVGEPQAAGRMANWDPLVCGNCNAPMSEPRQLGNKWVNTCTKCRATREIPLGHPLIQQRQRQEELSPYPELLQDVGPRRPWEVFAAHEDKEPWEGLPAETFVPTQAPRTLRIGSL